MPRQLDLPDRLAKYGLNVELVPGWETRGSSTFNPGGAVGHHTAGPRTGIRPSLWVCVNGRPGLPPPLCNTFLDRMGTVVVVGAGRANHAGVGGFRNLVGNSSVFGTEAEDDGDGHWTEAQLIAYPRVMAAQLEIAGKDHTWYCSHRTWAEPPGRKIDPAGIADAWMREQIRQVFAGMKAPAEEGEKDMFLVGVLGEDKRVFLVDGCGKRLVPNTDVLNELKRCGVPDKGEISSTALNLFPTYIQTGTIGGSTVAQLDEILQNTMPKAP